MATALTDLLAALNRDWVVGPHSSRFEDKLRQVRRLLAELPEAETPPSVLVCEADPVDYLAAVLGALTEDKAVWLGHAGWKQGEWDSFYQIARPAQTFGEAQAAPEAPLEAPCAPESGRLMVATGGSSGGLRFAVHSLKSIGAAVECLQRALGKDRPLHSATILPLHHVSGIMPAFRALLTGGKLLLPGASSLEEACEGREDLDQFLLSLVPTLVRRGLEDKARRQLLKQFRGIFVGGGAIDDYWLDRADRAELPLIPTYGTTETAGMITLLPSLEFSAGWRGSGRALPGVEIRIAQDDGTPRQIGPISLKTPALCEGYAGSNLRMERSWFVTGDEGFFNYSRNLNIVGREDRIINTGGEKVDPSVVEKVMMEINGCRSVLVTGVPDNEWGQRVIAFYTRRRENLDQVEIEAYLETRLSAAKRPKQYFAVERLPLDARGKLDQGQVRDYLKDSGNLSVSGNSIDQ